MDVSYDSVPGCSVAGLRFYSKSKKNARGLSLIELLVTLAVSSILFSLGVPALQTIVGSNRVTTQVNSLSGALALTRSEAIRQSVQAIICKSQDGQQCNSSGKWSDGWIVFVDTDWDLERDDTEPVLLAQERLPGQVTLTYNGFPTDNYIAYRPTGFAKMNGTFTFCSTGRTQIKRAVIVNWVGRPRISQIGPDGQALVCAETPS
jgi:type IV fimbrial biogenesis protein FimT